LRAGRKIRRPAVLQSGSGQRGALAAGAIACVLGLSAFVTQPTERFDSAFSDIALAVQGHPADPRIVSVVIEGADLAARDAVRLDRAEFAAAIDRIADAGARRILSDFLFPTNANPREERALKDAVSALGPDRMAFPTLPNLERQLEVSLSHAFTAVDLRLVPDDDGRFRRLRFPEGEQAANPALWLATGDRSFETTIIDRRLDPASVRTIRYRDLIDPSYTLPDLTGALVVIAPDQNLLQNPVNIPFHGDVDRGAMLAMAVQSHLESYEKTDRAGAFVQITIAALSLLIGLAIGSFAGGFRRALGALFLTVVVILLSSLLLVRSYGFALAPFLSISILLMSFHVALARRLRLAQILSGFMKGDLSPEEVWLWQSHRDSGNPVILFGSNGAIKRANAAALRIFDLGGDPSAGRRLTLSVFPSVGERTERIGSDRDSTVHAIDWPHPAVQIAIFRDITASVRKEQNISLQLITDPLTGVRNRFGFDQALARLQLEAREDYAVFFIDMNGFKAVNDTYGHEAGDQLLRAVAGRFSSVLRKPDVLARFGGDEFGVIVASGMNRDIASGLAAKLERQLEEPVRLDQAIVRVGAAVGFSLPAAPGESPSSVLSRADQAMYARKAQIKSAA